MHYISDENLTPNSGLHHYYPNTSTHYSYQDYDQFNEVESTSGYAEGEWVWTWIPKGQKCFLGPIHIAEDRISFDDVASLASKISDKVSSLIKEEQRQALLGTLNAKESLKDSVQDVRSRFTSFLDGKRRQGFGALTGPLVNYNIIFFHKCIHSICISANARKRCTRSCCSRYCIRRHGI